MKTLTFKQSNAKLHNTLTFSLPAGHACPAAALCKARADRITGRLTDGPQTAFRCFGATCEARSPSLRRMVWRNLETVQSAIKRGPSAVADLLDGSMPDYGGLVRVHSTGGDFFNKTYLKGWLEFAARRPGMVVRKNGMAGVIGTVFYGYTKMLPLFKNIKLPENFYVVASYGGIYDDMIPGSGLRSARVVMSEEEAESLGLPLDHDDSHAWNGDGDFAFMVHGTQPAGSPASKAREKNRKEGKFTGYQTKY